MIYFLLIMTDFPIISQRAHGLQSITMVVVVAERSERCTLKKQNCILYTVYDKMSFGQRSDVHVTYSKI